MKVMHLDTYSKNDFQVGAPYFIQILWYCVSVLLVGSQILPGSGWRTCLLRAFGAQVGRGVVWKPGVKIKYPWKLSVGDYTWVGERVWIDNVACISIGQHACLSQLVYLCSGSHDYSRNNFDLLLKPIVVGSHVWLAARASIAPGTTIHDGVVVTFASAVSGELEAWSVYRGAPAQKIKMREIKN
ncbi:MAG: WcaF family extracellular polysaccharide biosynthesis acetyltransferase [Bdellovibrionales bacterium]|nr:WcaF family extracellular polysaccharide biosynthesis acetyltransferase [Bdellovibrionales bacterium]